MTSIRSPVIQRASGEATKATTSATSRTCPTRPRAAREAAATVPPGAALAEEPTARAAIERILREAAAEYTDPAHPWGCLIIAAAVNCGSPDVEAELRAMREAGKRAIRDRIAADGLADPDTVATFSSSVIQGMSAQARDGVSREGLERVAAQAMIAWPGAR